MPKRTPDSYKQIISNRPLERLLIDSTRLPEELEHKEFRILTVIDHFSKYAHCKVFEGIGKIQTEIMLMEAMIAIGKPEIIQFDNGTEFINEDVIYFVENKNIHYIHSRPYHPETNGTVEVFQGYMKSCLRNYFLSEGGLGIKFNKVDVEYGLAKFLDEYNSTVHTLTKEKPRIAKALTNPQAIAEIIENTKLSRGKEIKLKDEFEVNQKVLLHNYLFKNGKFLDKASGLKKVSIFYCLPAKIHGFEEETIFIQISANCYLYDEVLLKEKEIFKSTGLIF